MSYCIEQEGRAQTRIVLDCFPCEGRHIDCTGIRELFYILGKKPLKGQLPHVDHSSPAAAFGLINTIIQKSFYTRSERESMPKVVDFDHFG